MRWALVVGATVLLPAGVSATTWEVEEGESIQAAINSAQYGDDVLVYPGVYEENITLETGVTVHSVGGSGQTTIDGGGASRAVYGWAVYDLDFGGEGAGFTIQGGTAFGILLFSCRTMDVEDMIVESDPSDAAIWCELSDTTIHFRDIRVHGLTQLGEDDAAIGLYANDYPGQDTHLVLDDAWIWDVDGAAIKVWGYTGEETPRTLRDVRIQYCSRGVYVEDADLKWVGTSIYSNYAQHTGRGVVMEILWSEAEWHWLDLKKVYFSDCDTTVVRVLSLDPWIYVSMDDCNVCNSDDGIALYPNSHGSITNCRFNTLSGTGVYLGSGVWATISGGCTFEGVSATGVLCETGMGQTFITGCDFDGSGGCFEAVHTSGLGTLAKVRSCQIVDYDTGVFPVPRAFYVFGYSAGTTADLRVDDEEKEEWGNSIIDGTGIDVYYAGLGTPGHIPCLYAQRNYWGEDDPWIAGAWADSVVWEPPLEDPPRGAPPAPGGDVTLPTKPALSIVSSNPAVGAVTFACELPGGGAVGVAVWDLRGRLVRTLNEGEPGAGRVAVEWDGTDEAGRSAASGAYVCRLRSAGRDVARRFVFLR